MNFNKLSELNNTELLQKKSGIRNSASRINAEFFFNKYGKTSYEKFIEERHCASKLLVS